MEYEINKYKKLRVFISGQKYFGAEVFRLCQKMGCEIVGVCVPYTDKYLFPLAKRFDIPIIIAGGTLNHENMPDNVDLGIAAHSFDYVGKKTRYKTELGWLGYHPSLLPRHRGRSAIEWAIKMKDFATGGSVFWLNGGIDRGDIFKQDLLFIDPKYFSISSKKAAKDLWHDQLLGTGLKLFGECITDIKNGKITKIKQDARYSTFEPSLNVKDIYKPDLDMLPMPTGRK